MSKTILDIYISPEDYLAHYQGVVKDVVAKDRAGRVVRFPSNILQPFVTRNGISGTFQIEFNTKNKFQRITKLSS